MKRLYFVRHGESELNRQRLFTGHTDAVLTNHGREQARLAGQQTDVTFDLILSSPLVRALETAQIIAAETSYPTVHILTNPLFMERKLGLLEGRSLDEFNEDTASFDGMESIEEFLQRARSGLAYLQELDAENILLASHGAFARAFQAAMKPGSNYADFSEPANAVILQFI
jgi:broad specificity phosphatase PhoE